MKKNILFIGLFVVVTVAATSQIQTKEKNLGGQALENIEALVAGKTGVYQECIGSGIIDCPIGHVKVRYVISYE